MAEITRAMEYAYGRLPYLVPNEVRKRIGSDELLDRLVYVSALMKRAEQERDRTAKAGFSAAASAVLGAPPREETEQLVKGIERKIAHCDATGSWFQGEQARRQLAEVRARQPMAPQRAARLTKAEKDGELMPVYDAAGNLVGLVKPGVVTQIADPAAVAKDALVEDALVEDEAEDDDEAVDAARELPRYLGPQHPPSPAGQSAVGQRGQVAKAARPRYNAMIQRRGPR